MNANNLNVDDEVDWKYVSDGDSESDEGEQRSSIQSGRPKRLSLIENSSKSYRITSSKNIFLNGLDEDKITPTGILRINNSIEKNDLRFNYENRLFNLRKIGQGVCGEVFKGFDLLTWNICAIKRIHMYQQVHRRQLVRELLTLRDDNEEEKSHLVKFIDAFSFTGGNAVGLVIEFMNKGSLQDIVDRGGLQDEDIVSYIAWQCILGLQSLHQRKRLHCDLKPANVLVNSSGQIKIADFGLMKTLNGNSSFSCHGTFTYMPPERLLDEDYDESSDIYSLGLTILATAQGKSPTKTYWEMVELHTRKESPNIFSDKDKYWSKEFQNFLSQCLERDPQMRPSVKELLNHAFIENQLSHSNKDQNNKMLDFFTALPPNDNDLNMIIHAIRSSIDDDLFNLDDENKLINLSSQLNMDIDVLTRRLHDAKQSLG